MDDVAERLLELAGGDPFRAVRVLSEEHQIEHGCGLHHAGGPVMQLVASITRAARPQRVLDLGCGLGYSTLWIAQAAGPDAHVIGIDDDPRHIEEAERLAQAHGLGDRITYRCGAVVDVLGTLDSPVDMIHDDAWFARPPAHLDAAIGLLRTGGVLTMANWFLLVDALTGQPRNDWERFAGPTWAVDTVSFARQLAARDDLEISWITTPPVGLATKS
ncbi:O-methyltransferase [Ilumatobacter sp.]|uniref:O-methyltransferase n=1 Tax=Ilumatobacter sp. TaxID=1967498 RepID=UPI003C47757D